MKLLLVLGSDDNYDAIIHTLAPLNLELIRYRHVLKAMDNIDEIDPSAIIISARDFPRHWKVMVQFTRTERSKEACPIIILKGESFSAEETSKAFFMGVNTVVNDALERDEEIYRIKTILGSQASSPEQTPQFCAEPWHRIGLLIGDLSDKSFIVGEVKTISSNGLSFIPEQPPAKTVDFDITVNKELRECSLRVGDAILSPVCRITGTGKTITMDFVSFPGDEQRTLERCLQETFA